MPKVDEIKVLTIDNVPYAVDTMSDEVKQLVAVFNEWNQKEVDAENEYKLIKYAKNELSRQIIATIRSEKQSAEENDTPTTTDSTDTQPPGDE